MLKSRECVCKYMNTAWKYTNVLWKLRKHACKLQNALWKCMNVLWKKINHTWKKWNMLCKVWNIILKFRNYMWKNMKWCGALSSLILLLASIRLSNRGEVNDYLEGEGNECAKRSWTLVCYPIIELYLLKKINLWKKYFF